MEVVTREKNRFYKVDNKEYISVTSLVSTFYVNKGLTYWKSKTSLEEQEKISKVSLEIGNTFHKNVENYFNKEEHTLKEYELSFIKELNLAKVQTEVPFVFSNKNLGYAGTIDCICELGSEKVVIDWKTTKKKKYYSNLLNYFLQLSAYCFCTKRSKGLIVLNNYIKEEFNLYKLTSSELEFFFENFSKMVYDFYNKTTYFSQDKFEEESKQFKLKEYKL